MEQQKKSKKRGQKEKCFVAQRDEKTEMEKEDIFSLYRFAGMILYILKPKYYESIFRQKVLNYLSQSTLQLITNRIQIKFFSELSALEKFFYFYHVIPLYLSILFNIVQYSYLLISSLLYSFPFIIIQHTNHGYQTIQSFSHHHTVRTHHHWFQHQQYLRLLQIIKWKLAENVGILIILPPSQATFTLHFILFTTLPILYRRIMQFSFLFTFLFVNLMSTLKLG